jgi:hypothetical protein
MATVQFEEFVIIRDVSKDNSIVYLLSCYETKFMIIVNSVGEIVKNTTCLSAYDAERLTMMLECAFGGVKISLPDKFGFSDIDLSTAIYINLRSALERIVRPGDLLE